jgi:hypothetical protein
LGKEELGKMISWLILLSSAGYFIGNVVYYKVNSLPDIIKILGWCLSAALLGFILDASTLATAYQVWSVFLVEGMHDFRGTTISQLPNFFKATTLIFYSGFTLKKIKEITINYGKRSSDYI